MTTVNIPPASARFSSSIAGISSFVDRPILSGWLQSTITSVSKSAIFFPEALKASNVSNLSCPGRKRYCAGMGCLSSSTHFFPRLLRASDRAKQEPIASPSGLTWVAIRKLSRESSASTNSGGGSSLGPICRLIHQPLLRVPFLLSLLAACRS